MSIEIFQKFLKYIPHFNPMYLKSIDKMRRCRWCGIVIQEKQKSDLCEGCQKQKNKNHNKCLDYVKYD